MAIKIYPKFIFLIFRKSEKVSNLYVYLFKSARPYLIRVVKWIGLLKLCTDMDKGKVPI